MSEVWEELFRLWCSLERPGLLEWVVRTVLVVWVVLVRPLGLVRAAPKFFLESGLLESGR